MAGTHTVYCSVPSGLVLQIYTVPGPGGPMINVGGTSYNVVARFGAVPAYQSVTLNYGTNVIDGTFWQVWADQNAGSPVMNVLTLVS